jgi:hypothetical protein
VPSTRFRACIALPFSMGMAPLGFPHVYLHLAAKELAAGVLYRAVNSLRMPEWRHEGRKRNV